MNILGVFLITFVPKLVISPSIGNLISGLVFSALTSPIAMIFTILPYAIGLFVIKRRNNPSLWGYGLGGASASMLSCLWFYTVGEGTPPITFLYFAFVGAVCGLLYGLLDRSIQIRTKKGLHPKIGGNRTEEAQEERHKEII